MTRGSVNIFLREFRVKSEFLEINSKQSLILLLMIQVEKFFITRLFLTGKVKLGDKGNKFF